MAKLSTDPDADAVRTVDMRVDYGDLIAVDGLSLTIPRGEVYGLIGPNGAGKTSSFKVLATLMEPTYGDVFIGGVDVALRPEEARKHLGYMPDLAPVASDLKVWEFLDLFAAAQGIPDSRRVQRIGECLERVSLPDKRNTMCKDLSRGMMQRLVLAKTLLHEPSLYLLDEPASGMDPVSRAALRGTLRELARDGASVLVSSHILSELEDMCTMVGFMSEGRLVDSGRVEEVVSRHEQSSARRLVATAAGDGTALVAFLEEHHAVLISDIGKGRVSFELAGDDEAQADLLHDAIGAGTRIKSLSEQRASIEQILLDMDSNEKAEGSS